jgi:hypothetical protein
MASKLEGNPLASANSGTELTVTLSPSFKLVFVSVLAVTVFCLIVSCCLVGLSIGSGHSMDKDVLGLFDLCSSTFKLGFGAIIGLLGGKAL